MTESGTPRDDESTRDIVRLAARSVGSLSDTEFEILFNPDVYQDHVKHANPDVRIAEFVAHFIMLEVKYVSVLICQTDKTCRQLNRRC